MGAVGMTFDEATLDSEACSRAYKSIIMLEDVWGYLMLSRFRYIQWRKKLWFKDIPPIIHAGYVWGDPWNS